MCKWMLAAGVAALAIASPTLAEKGGKGGGSNDKSAQAQKGGKGGGDKVDRGQKARGGDRQMVRASSSDRPDRGQQARGGGQERKAVRVTQSDDRGRGGGKPDKVMKVEDRGGGRDNVKSQGRELREARFDDDKVKGRGKGVDNDARIVRFDDDDDDIRFVPRWNERGLARGFINGCPPGLAKQGTGCLPPGQAKKLVGTVLAPSIMAQGLAGPYRLWYPDDDDFLYRWDDDYIYRVRRDGGLIDALFPYDNRDYYYYPVGAAYPSYFNYYNVPYQYQSFYPNGGDNWYRYGDGAIYMVDPQTQMISGIAALLTGAPMAVGQPLPPTYGVYNVPLAYRSTYYDTPDAMYRYNDGYIYRVDPTTMLITAMINALV